MFSSRQQQVSIHYLMLV